MVESVVAQRGNVSEINRKRKREIFECGLEREKKRKKGGER